MNAAALVTVDDLRQAADDVEKDERDMRSLGFPVPNRRDIPHVIRLAAMQLELLKVECWRLSQGTSHA